MKHRMSKKEILDKWNYSITKFQDNPAKIWVKVNGTGLTIEGHIIDVGNVINENHENPTLSNQILTIWIDPEQ